MGKRFINFLIMLAFGLASLAQTAEKDSLRASFLRYQAQAPQEKLFVHVDKSFYLAGETVWYKLYDIDGGLVLSGIAYVEVLDKDQHPILQEKIELREGKGDGSFHLPISTPSGCYTFRAYTSWMKNFSPDLYYQQQLTVLNTLTETGASPPAAGMHDPGSVGSSPATGMHDPGSGGSSPATGMHDPGSGAADSFAIRFFPEGGSLVDGLSSTIAFKAVNPSGEGIACQGVVLDAHKDTVAHFHTGRLGMGRFTLTPESGNTYYALVNFGPSTVMEKLPAAYHQGYTLHLDDIDAHTLRAVVHSASVSGSPALFLFVHTHDRIKTVQANYLTNNETSFSIDKDSLDDGISHLTVFNGERMPVCERLYCKPPGRQMHIDVKTTAAEFKTRRKITVDLSATDPAGHPLNADLSLSVFLLDSLQSIPGENILSYLLLGSDLKGKIESPQSYFADTDPATTEALDNLMLTQGWTRFRWDDILQNKKPYFEFLPETSGPIIGGKVVDKRTGLAPAQVIGYLTVPGRHFKLSTTLSQPDGMLFFHVGNFYGNKEIIVQTNSQTDSNYRIDVASPFSDRFASPLPGPDLLFAKKEPAQLLYRSIDVQVENAYRTAEKRHLRPLVEDTVGFYGDADRKYNLDEYTRFTTMDEVIREYVEDVRVRRQSDKAYFRVRNALFNTFFEDDPLLLVDGVPVFDGNKMIGINPLKIEKVDVVSHRYYFGPSITDGLISFRSYDGDLGGYQLDPSAVVVQFSGLQQHREFYSPAYETTAQVQSTIPDLRNQLLWSPTINTGAAGKKQLTVYTSDLTGKFALVVQGMTSDGLAGYSVRTFTVQ